MANIVHFKPEKVTASKLKPELQAIFDELPGLIDYCERNGQRLAELIIENIKDEINLTPEKRELIIIRNRDKYAERYLELITSGLRLKATDKEEILQLIGLRMYSLGTWKIPLPKDCIFESIKPDPKGHLHSAIAPIFQFYAIVQACNNLLNPPTPATGTHETPATDTESKEEKIKRILEPLRVAFDTSGHLDKIIIALAEYDKNGAPLDYQCRAILINNKAFYKPFYEINEMVHISFTGIAEVLHKFIYANNGSRNAIKVTSIIQNFKRPEYKSK